MTASVVKQDPDTLPCLVLQKVMVSIPTVSPASAYRLTGRKTPTYLLTYSCSSEMAFVHWLLQQLDHLVLRSETAP